VAYWGLVDAHTAYRRLIWTDGEMTKRKQAKDTITAVELNKGETLEFRLLNGDVRRVALLDTGAEVTETTIETAGREEPGGRTNYRFWCWLAVEEEEYRLEREVSTQRSFYDPWRIAGMDLWFDAVDDIFTFLQETHGACRPGADARFGIQDASVRICPVQVHAWCPLPDGGLRIEDCYNGEDCWLGAYFGASAHGGLDINHLPGTPLWAPIDLDDHFYFNSLEMGHNNNRWRAIRRWPNGSEWILQAHHMTALTVQEHTTIQAGVQFASGAGVLSGSHDHSHFVFKVHDEGETVMLDPWILFRQMYLDT